MRKPPLSCGCLVLGFSKHFFAFYKVGPLSCLLVLLPEVEGQGHQNVGNLSTGLWFQLSLSRLPVLMDQQVQQEKTRFREEEGGRSGLIPSCSPRRGHADYAGGCLDGRCAWLTEVCHGTGGGAPTEGWHRFIHLPAGLNVRCQFWPVSVN